MTEFETNTRRLGPSPQPAQSGVNPMPPQDTLSRICGQALRQSVAIVPDRITELERQLGRALQDVHRVTEELSHVRTEARFELDAMKVQVCDMVVQRDHALLRMEVAIATSHAWIDAEVRRRIAEATDHAPRAFPASALRQQRQAIGLLSTADAGRVRLGGYAPSLPPR